MQHARRTQESDFWSLVIPATVVLKDARLLTFARELNTPRAKTVLKKKIGAIYRSFAMQRFSRLSRGGGGEWRPLSPKTIARRRKKSSSILIDTGTLFAVLSPAPSSAWLEQDRSNGFRFGYGGPTKAPGANATLADIASFHHEGAGHLPARKIIVEPDTETLNIMTKRIVEWLAKQIQ